MLSTRHASGGASRSILGILIAAFIAAGCAAGTASAPGNANGGRDAAGGGAGAPEPQQPGLVGGGTDSGAGGSGGGDGKGNGDAVSYLAGQPDLQIIKTGTITLQVAGIDDAVGTATGRITSLGGYASGSTRTGDGDAAAATVTYRIPAARWDEALVALRGLASKVLDEKTSTDDVTSQVVDLAARITNLQATERALQAIMARATEIKDVLSVQAELTKTRGEIEQLTAQKTHLEQQAAMSTLTVGFTLKPNAVLTSQERFDPASEADRAAGSLVSILQGLATAGIWFAIVWLPILIAIAIVVAIVAVVVRRYRRTTGGTPVLPTAEGGA